MKTKHNHFSKNGYIALLAILLTILIPIQIEASTQQQDVIEYNQYSGIVVDSQSGEPLVFATLTVDNTNISTVTNTEGDFILKTPTDIKNATLTISTLGYKKKTISLSQLKEKDNIIKLKSSVIKLSEVIFKLPKDAKSLVEDVFKNKRKNYTDEDLIMTAFYRETIKKRRRNVSLAEAVVDIYKQPYANMINDKIRLNKARKSTDYSKLDTVALKLQGGPFNTLFGDIIKYRNHIFTEDTFNLYDFSFSPSTTINEDPVYVVDFKQQSHITEPLFYGKLYIDAETKSLKSAIYNLNVSNKDLSAKLFVKRKPRDIFVYPTAVAYRVDYREKDNKWFYSYSNAQLTFKIKRKGKWFNSEYSVNSEMAITDWKTNISKEKPTYKERMRYSIIIGDEASGFSDPNFWGAHNVIEPEKSIESAIKKINKQLKSDND